MRHLIHYYGDWEALPIPSDCEALYIKWKKNDGMERYNKLSAIVFRTSEKPSLSQLVEHIVAKEKEQPTGVSYKYELL